VVQAAGFLLGIYLAFVLLVHSAAAEVVLSEIMFDAPVSEAFEEYIELYNTSATDWVDLTGWQIGTASERDSVLAHNTTLTLRPQGYALVLDPGYWGHSTIYDSLVDPTTLVLTISDVEFGVSGLRNDRPDTVVLVDSSGVVQATYIYVPDNPDGYSDEKIRLTSGDPPANWHNSLTYLGTPGKVNSVQPLDLDLAISALSAIPSPLPCGVPVALTVRLKNLGLLVTPAGELSLALGSLNSPAADSLLATLDYPGLLPADSVEITTTISSLPPGPHNILAWHSLVDANPQNDSLSLLLPRGYPAGSLVINEIMAHPAAGQGEWVDFRFSDSDTAHEVQLTQSSLILDPAGFIVLAEDSTIIPLLPEDGKVIVLQDQWPTLNDDGDAPVLYDAAGEVQDSVNYTDWSVPTGQSLERLSPNSPSCDPANWRSSTDSSGATPDRPNSAQISPAPGETGALTFTPNPFDPERQENLQIHLSLPDGSTSAAVIVFDLRGRRLKIIFDGEPPYGQMDLLWNGKDSEGRRLTPGLYVLFAEFRDSGGNRRSSLKKTLVIGGKL
jgi:hypothetical protein